MDPKYSTLRSVFFACSLLLLASCSGDVEGMPSTHGPNSLSTAPEEEGYVVPEVPRNLDVSSYLENPCKLLSNELMQSMQYRSEGESRTGENGDVYEYGGPACSWDSLSGSSHVLMGIHSGIRDRKDAGLEGRYQVYKSGHYAYWEPVDIQGYPAAFYAMRDKRKEGDCGLGVGIAEDLTIGVSVTGYSDAPEQACVVAEKIAGSAVSTLKGAS